MPNQNVEGVGGGMMIKKLICFLWGHKFMAKAYTGQSMKITNYLGQESLASLYRWEAQKYCLRCGIRNPNIKD